MCSNTWSNSLTARLKKAIRQFHQTVCADSKAPVRVKAVNTLLNSGYNLRILDDGDIETIWESLFFALWYAEMGRGCEEIIAAIERACSSSYKLTRVGLLTISKRWYGLDQYRIDKTSHLARHLLPVIIDQQIKMWLKTRRKQKLGTQNIRCKRLLKKALNDIVDSNGLCYFILEILADEISKTLIRIYDEQQMIVGKFELKADLIVFLYKQVIAFASNIRLDARLLRTFDQYVIKKFIVEILPNESQLTQILISLRLYQTLDEHIKGRRDNQQLNAKCRALFMRWSEIIQDIHEKCLNGELFPTSILPIKGTIKWRPNVE